MFAVSICKVLQKEQTGVLISQMYIESRQNILWDQHIQLDGQPSTLKRFGATFRASVNGGDISKFNCSEEK